VLLMGLFRWLGRLRGASGLPRIGNAPVDPNSAQPTAAELTDEFRILRATWLMSKSGPMPKFEEIHKESPWFNPDAPPSAVIFLSHRWESPKHPDPNGAQADALRAFLGAVRSLSEVRGGTEDERRAQVPSLLVHGVLQAAYFLDNAIAFGGPEGGAWGADSKIDVVLDSVGVWYDYSCMPQDGLADLSLVPGLQHIHQLIGESTMLILRRPNDHYDERAWCAAEISEEPDRARQQCERIVLRMDLLNRPFPLKHIIQSDEPRRAPDMRIAEALFGTSTSEFSRPLREIMAKGLEDWIEDPESAFARLHRLYIFLSEVEDEREVPLFTARRNPELFRGQRTLLLEMIERLRAVTETDFALGRKGRFEVDVAAEVLGAMKKAKLRTSAPEDLLFTGLMILYSRHRGVPRMAAFYGECLARYFAKKSLRLARYRELRDGMSLDVWCVFDDEPLDSPRWKPRKLRAH
jgi:hypothetical protein